MARILVADDEADVLEQLVDMLEYVGWQTGTAANGVEAVISALDESWDLVLMDIRMPKLDGINALRIIKHFHPNLPVVMFTGQAGQGDMLESARLGAFTCLTKPIDTDKLTQVIHQALSHSATLL
ncbi:MAG: Regulatory protein AtoC [Anaerolineae bacterium]|nr:Regulatory protein AtoC [Anaerolineae bacterium]